MRVETKISGYTELRATLDELALKALPAVASAAVNKAAGAGRTRMAKIIAGELNLKPKVGPGGRTTPGQYIKKNLTIRKASRKNAQALLKLRQRPTSATRFIPEAKQQIGAFRNAPGVSFKAFKNGSTKLIQGSFLFTAPNGQVIVGKRKGPGRDSKLESYYGPSLYEIGHRKENVRNVNKRIIEVLKSEFKARMNLAIGRSLSRNANKK